MGGLFLLNTVCSLHYLVGYAHHFMLYRQWLAAPSLGNCRGHLSCIWQVVLNVGMFNFQPCPEKSIQPQLQTCCRCLVETTIHVGMISIHQTCCWNMAKHIFKPFETVIQSLGVWVVLAMRWLSYLLHTKRAPIEQVNVFLFSMTSLQRCWWIEFDSSWPRNFYKIWVQNVSTERILQGTSGSPACADNMCSPLA